MGTKLSILLVVAFTLNVVKWFLPNGETPLLSVFLPAKTLSTILNGILLRLQIKSNLLPSGWSLYNEFSSSQVGQTESKTDQVSTPGRSQSNIHYLHKTQLKLFSVTESKDVWK
jgi:hypothetical protein